jgi:hypothetical protein
VAPGAGACAADRRIGDRGGIGIVARDCFQLSSSRDSSDQEEDIGNGNDPRRHGPSELHQEATVERGILRPSTVGGGVAVKKAFEPLPLVDWEKRAGTALCALVLLLGILLLFFIQCDIGKHRRRIGRDADAYSRGLEFTVPLGLTIIVACCTVVYGL